MAIFMLVFLSMAAHCSAFFDQFFGGGGGHHHGGGRPNVDYAQFPRGVTDEIHENYEWLMDTVWNWNDWNEVKFRGDGIFEAPTDDCQALEGACKWSASRKKIYIVWGNSGLHVLKSNKMQAVRGAKLRGRRTRDNDRVKAKFVRQEESTDEDLYEVLGVEPDATDRDIKKAFRKLSIKYHPDKQRTEEEKVSAKEKYEKITRAHDVLSDPEKRILYDNGGMKMVNDPNAGGGGGGGHDPFSAFFGGGGGGGGGSGNKGEDYRAEMEVDLANMYNGHTIETGIQRRVVCRGCKRRKRRKTAKCQACDRCPDEVKMVKRQMGPGMFVQQQMQVKSKERCKMEEVKLKILVEKGMRHGAEVKFDRMSEQTPGEVPGDVIFVIKQKKHSRFRRSGDDLKMTLHVTLKEALLGFERNIMHLDDHIVIISTKGVTAPGTVIKVEQEGMPVHNFPSSYGDLFVSIEIDFPKKLSKANRDKILSAF